MSISVSGFGCLDDVEALPYGRLDPAPAPNEPGNRVDFRPSRIDTLIATKGYRLLWSRASECPCEPLDRQLQVPDPNCPLCSGEGLYYFRPEKEQDLKGEYLTPVQEEMVRRSGGFLIRGMMAYLSTNDTITDRMGEWRGGQSTVSVQAGNALAFRDRLISIDQQMTFREVVRFSGEVRSPLPLRYLVTGGVHDIRTVQRVLVPEADWTIQSGSLVMLAGDIRAGTRIAVSYQTCPTWVVMDMPHAERVINKRLSDGMIAAAKKMPTLGGDMPGEGRPIRMPIQARVQLQFIPFDRGEGPL